MDDGQRSGGEAQRAILLLEDDEGSAYAARRVLERGGYTVFEARTVRDALGMLAGMRPAAAVLDLGMPDGSGADVYLAMKKSERLAQVPVILVTGREREELPPGLERAAAVIAKPMDPDRLLSVLSAVVR